MDKLNRFRRLRPGEQRILLAALIRLPLMALALRVLGFRRLQNTLLKFGASFFLDRSDGAGSRYNDGRNIGKMVSAAAKEGIYQANCLEQSLTLWWMLRRHGIASQLKIGVRRENDQFEAHAWVELDGSVLNDDPDVHQDYSSFPQDIASLHAEIQ